MKTFAWFLALCLAIGGVALLPGWLLYEHDLWLPCAAAWGLSFVPAALTLGWALGAFAGQAETQLLAVMGGSLLRMAAALGGGFFLSHRWPDRFDTGFWILLLGNYLAILAAEIAVIVRRAGPQGTDT